MTQQRPEHHLLDDAWDGIVGGMDWLKSVLFGEFSDHRPLSAVVADMLLSFIPGVVIVTSARDATAVILRMAHHPEKREELMEWVLLCACLIVIALPIAMTVAGAAVALVGGVVGGIAGSELGAALRAVMLMLIKESQKLVELVRFLQQFIKGDILKFLRAVNFAKYEKPLMHAMGKVIGILMEVVRVTRAHLETMRYFDSVKVTIAKLVEWEKKFYALQHDAIKHMPKALAELDARLAKVLAQMAPKEMHTVAAGVEADKTVAAIPAIQRVRDTPGKILAKVEEKAPPAVAKPKVTSKPKPNPKEPPKPHEPPPKDSADPIKRPEEGANKKKQVVADAAVAADRERITQLSNEGRIAEARAILQVHLDAANRATTSAEKAAAMDEIVARLDVTSDKEKMFWSGNKELAKKIALEKGKIVLEQTPGGRVIDEWHDLNNTFTWNDADMGPYGWDLWGDVSANYSKDAFGAIEVIQDVKKFPNGGPTWLGREFPTIVNQGKVSSINIFSMDAHGNIIDSLKLDPYSEAARTLFGVK